MKKPSRFIYWAFDLLALLLIGVIVLGHSFHLSQAWEQTLAVIVIVVVYSLIALWGWANPTARMDPDKARVAKRQGENRPHLTEVQAHYQQVFEMNSKRK